MINHEINLIRYKILKSCFVIKEGHIGSAFSILEIIYVIFKKYIIKTFICMRIVHIFGETPVTSIMMGILGVDIDCRNTIMSSNNLWTDIHMNEKYSKYL